MKIEIFKPEHMLSMDVQDAQSTLSAFVTPEYACALADPAHGSAYTGVHEGRVIFSAGIVDVWAGRAMVWAYIARTAGDQFLGVHRAVKKFLDMQTGLRLETTVDASFEQGHRWAKMLGFEMETPCMRGYLPNGNDAAMYVRIR